MFADYALAAALALAALFAVSDAYAMGELLQAAGALPAAAPFLAIAGVGAATAMPRGILGATFRADASDPMAVLAQLQQAFNAFKAENETKLAAKAGKEDVVTNEKVDRINAAVGELQASLSELAIKIAAAAITGGGAPRPGDDAAYNTAFTAYARTGDGESAIKAQQFAGPRATLALDPGLRTGCKVAVVDATGKVLETATVYPHAPRNDWDGTLAILDWMAQAGERMDVCIVGEPSNPEIMGEMIKIGRRGSLTATITATGKQGHAAYPHRANNPLHALVRLLAELTAAPLDEGTEHFDPSGLQITTIDCGNPASNVIPEKATAVVNIRFNDAHSGDSLTAMLRERAAALEAETGVRFGVEVFVSGESFLTQPGPFVDLVRDVVAGQTGVTPVLSTSGGTSDARFVKDMCPVLEFGLVGAFMHQVDERVPVAQVRQLKDIYQAILARYFA